MNGNIYVNSEIALCTNNKAKQNILGWCPIHNPVVRYQ